MFAYRVLTVTASAASGEFPVGDELVEAAAQKEECSDPSCIAATCLNPPDSCVGSTCLNPPDSCVGSTCLNPPDSCVGSTCLGDSGCGDSGCGDSGCGDSGGGGCEFGGDTDCGFGESICESDSVCEQDTTCEDSIPIVLPQEDPKARAHRIGAPSLSALREELAHALRIDA